MRTSRKETITRWKYLHELNHINKKKWMRKSQGETRLAQYDMADVKHLQLLMSIIKVKNRGNVQILDAAKLTTYHHNKHVCIQLCISSIHLVSQIIVMIFRAHAHDLYPKCYILIAYKDIFLFFIVSIIVRMSLYDYRLLRVLRNFIFWCIFPKWVLWFTQRNQLGKSIREFFCWISRDIVLSLLNLPIENNKIKIVMQIVLTKGK